MDFDREFVLNELSEGFKVVTDGCYVGSVEFRNYGSALSKEVAEFFSIFFQKEVDEGKLSIRSEKPPRVHSIGAVVKKCHEGFRPITYCSRPAHNSLNSYMVPQNFSLESLDTAMDLCAPGCFWCCGP